MVRGLWKIRWTVVMLRKWFGGILAGRWPCRLLSNMYVLTCAVVVASIVIAVIAM